MFTRFYFFLSWLAAAATAASTIAPYPIYSGQVLPLDDDGNLMAEFGELMKPSLAGGSSSITFESLSQIAFKAESRIKSTAVLLTSSPGRMSLPALLIQQESTFNAGVDNHFVVGALAPSTENQPDYMAVGLLWTMLINRFPDQSINAMTARALDPQPNVLDVLRLQASLGYMPGLKSEQPLSKDVWQSLHRSPNPVYRLIALEKFDSVEQSPMELLALYRECLFGACSYLEVRALEAITRNRDFREEVAKLLEDYIASNPPANDGTMPGLRNDFPNLIDGAKRVIAVIRDPNKPALPPPQQPGDGVRDSTATKTPPMVRPPAPKKAPEAQNTHTPSEEPTSSTPWSIIGVLIVAALGLLWLLLKRRS